MKTENAIGALLGGVEREVKRTLTEDGVPVPRVSERDVFEGRLQSDSFYEAETVKRDLHTLFTPTPTTMITPTSMVMPTPTAMIAPIPLPPPSQREGSVTSKPKRKKRRAYGVPSGPWAFALILLGGGVTFIAAAIVLEPRTKPAPTPHVVVAADAPVAPPPALDSLPWAADAGTKPPHASPTPRPARAPASSFTTKQ